MSPALLLIAQVQSQAAAEPLRFEVASVKAVGADTENITIVGIRGGPGTADPGQIHCDNVTLKRLLMNAYGVKAYQISGPAWLDSERYTIVAKVPAGATREGAQRMMQQLLRERFKIELHRQLKELPLYELVVAKGGLKMKEAAPKEPGTEQDAGSRGPSPSPSGARPTATAGMAAAGGGGGGEGASRGAGYHKMWSPRRNMASLASLLEFQLDRPVRDLTGLTGEYMIALEYTLTDSAGDVPSIFTALQEQLGLKLEAKKGPVEVLVIDRAGKTPTEN